MEASFIGGKMYASEVAQASIPNYCALGKNYTNSSQIYFQIKSTNRIQTKY